MPRVTKAKRVRQVALPEGMPVMLDRAQIIAAIPVGRTHFEKMLKNDEFPPPDATLAHKRLWRLETFTAWFAARFPKKD